MKPLNHNEGCMKCCHFFVEHHTGTCPNDFPNPLMYRSLTQNDANCAKGTYGRGVATMASLNNMNIPSASSSFTEPILHPVAAVLGMSHNPIT